MTDTFIKKVSFIVLTKDTPCKQLNKECIMIAQNLSLVVTCCDVPKGGGSTATSNDPASL